MLHFPVHILSQRYLLPRKRNCISASILFHWILSIFFHIYIYIYTTEPRMHTLPWPRKLLTSDVPAHPTAQCPYPTLRSRIPAPFPVTKQVKPQFTSNPLLLYTSYVTTFAIKPVPLTTHHRKSPPQAQKDKTPNTCSSPNAAPLQTNLLYRRVANTDAAMKFCKLGCDPAKACKQFQVGWNGAGTRGECRGVRNWGGDRWHGEAKLSSVVVVIAEEEELGTQLQLLRYHSESARCCAARLDVSWLVSFPASLFGAARSGEPTRPGTQASDYGPLVHMPFFVFAFFFGRRSLCMFFRLFLWNISEEEELWSLFGVG